MAGIGGVAFRDGMARGQAGRFTRSSTWALLTALAIIVSGLIASGPAAASYEFAGRGGRDIVVGVPGAEAVVVVPGSADGPRPGRAQRLSAADLGLRSDVLGPVGSGDIDGDGHDDLVVAQSREYPDSGAVRVVPGSRHGLRVDRVYPVERPDDVSHDFGHRLLVADLDRDGFHDVIVGYWGESDVAAGIDHQGGITRRVAVMWGSPDGVRADGATTVDSPTRGDRGIPLLLGAGNVEGDRNPELVVVAPGDPQTYGNGGERDGQMLVCQFDADRAARCGKAITVPPVASDMAVGDFVGGGRADVVVGYQPQGVDGEESGGHLQVYRTTPRGFVSAMVTQDSAGVPGTSELHDRFGASLAAADIDGDGKTDLAVGAPGENRGAGRVTVLYGHRAGLAHRRARMISQQTPGVPDRDQRGDAFGFAVGLLDVDGNGAADLVVGAPFEKSDAGAVTVVRATAAGRLAPRAATSVLRPRHVGVATSSGDPARMGIPVGQ